LHKESNFASFVEAENEHLGNIDYGAILKSKK